MVKGLPFRGIQSRNATAVILSFFGMAENVLVMMRKLSHQTRAYIFNAGGLKGFLVREPIIWGLLEAEED